MYPEFIAIYVGLGIILALVIALLVLVIIMMVKMKNMGGSKPSYYGGGMPAMQTQMGVVFCKKCTMQFDASERLCPRCGTPR